MERKQQSPVTHSFYIVTVTIKRKLIEKCVCSTKLLKGSSDVLCYAI